MLKYSIDFKPGGFSEDEVKESGCGGCDALLLVSINRDGLPAHSGAVSYRIVSVDSTVNTKEGLLEPIPDTEVFQIMSVMAHELMSKNIPDWQRKIASWVFRTVKSVMESLPDRSMH